MTKKTSLIDFLKKTDLNKLVRGDFQSIEDLARDFVKYNELSEPVRTQETNRGLILDFDEAGLVILSSASPDGIQGRSLESPIGGDGSRMYSSDAIIYFLSGKLNNKKISLEAEVHYTQDYKMEQYGPKEFLPTPIPTNKKKKYVFRKDKEDYWFVNKKD